MNVTEAGMLQKQRSYIGLDPIAWSLSRLSR